jgi:hypothetical protein
MWNMKRRQRFSRDWAFKKRGYGESTGTGRGDFMICGASRCCVGIGQPESWGVSPDGLRSHPRSRRRHAEQTICLFVSGAGSGSRGSLYDSSVLFCASKRARQLAEAGPAIENGSLRFLSPLKRSQIQFGHAAQAARRLRTGASGGNASVGWGKLRLNVSTWEVGNE